MSQDAQCAVRFLPVRPRSSSRCRYSNRSIVLGDAILDGRDRADSSADTRGRAGLHFIHGRDPRWIHVQATLKRATELFMFVACAARSATVAAVWFTPRVACSVIASVCFMPVVT